MPREAKLERTDAGLVPASDGWFVLNAMDARWVHREGRGESAPLTGWTDDEAEAWFPQLGVNLVVLGPGEPLGMYHWEADQEGLLVLSGEALLVIEGEERLLRAWDYVHCPPGTSHTIVGAGAAPCAILAVGAREHQTGAWGGYVADEVALRHGAAHTEETDDAAVAYARFPAPVPTRYRTGLLPWA